ncbi:MAG TPA: TonB-dependent receptor, partial [Rhodocyclaceae bacterium]
TAPLSAAESDGNSRPALQAAPIVVTATRSAQSSFDLPVSIDVVEGAQITEAQPLLNAAEALARVPGLVAPNQYRLSSDQQLSSRGFGSRAAFGVRGIRIYSDGIPQTMPDGQGQPGTFNLATAERMEVMRGPFSALYGNSAGGVVQIFSRDAAPEPTLSASYYAGDFDTWRAGLQFGGQFGAVNALVDGSRYQTDGFRQHSAAQRDQLSARLVMRASDADKITFVASDLDQPYNEDPQGLTRVQMEADPTGTQTTSTTFNTGGSKAQTHLGMNWEHRVDERNDFAAMVYGGQRDSLQRLGFVGGGALQSGGVSVIARDFSGVDLRWRHVAPLASGALTVTAGLNFDTMEDVRQGYENNSGVLGLIKRDEVNVARNFDQYVQAEWLAGADWVFSGGLRHSEIRLESEDRYIVGANPDDSGSVKFTSTNPVVGVLYHLTPAVNLYANAGRGFETPTLIEIAYRSDGGSGSNFALRPSESTHVEAGVKAFIGGTRVNAAVFRAETSDEIVVDTNTGGRATYKNAGDTSRQGIEVSVGGEIAGGLSAYASYAYLDAQFDDSFLSNGSTVASGNKIPGAPESTAYAELAWRLPAIGLFTAVEANYIGRTYVNDLNADSVEPSTVVNWRLSFTQQLGRFTLSEFARVENLFDEDYVGGVLVNAGFNRYFAPAPGRNALLGVSLAARF